MEIKELQSARERIDVIDEQIAKLFNERQRLSAEIARIKKENGLQTLDLGREEIVMKQAEERCGLYGRELFRCLMELSKKEQARHR